MQVGVDRILIGELDRASFVPCCGEAEDMDVRNDVVCRREVVRGLSSFRAVAAEDRPDRAFVVYRVIQKVGETLHWDALSRKTDQLGEAPDEGVNIGSEPILVRLLHLFENLV